MKKYIIQKVVFGNSMSDVVAMEKGGEVTNIELLDNINEPKDFGFNNYNEKRSGEGNKMV